MPTANSLNGLYAMIKQRASAAMEDEVFEEVRDVYQKHIDSDVYDAYSPASDVRRDVRGGLIADENIVGNMSGESLEVKNVTPPSESIATFGQSFAPESDTQLMDWIEHGAAYHGNAKYIFNRDMSGEPWANPRPATQNTIDDLRANGQHIEALKRGLKSRGIDSR